MNQIKKITYSEYLEKSPYIKDLLNQSEKYTRNIDPMIFEMITGINLKWHTDKDFNEGDIVVYSKGLIKNKYAILRKEFGLLFPAFPVIKINDCESIMKIYDSQTGEYYYD